MSLISKAFVHGFNGLQILDYVKRRFPKHARTIDTAQKSGYSPEDILKKLSFDEEGHDPSLTEHEKVMNRDKTQKRKAALGVVGALGTAGAVAAGAYGYATRNKAIRPNEILPAQGRGQQAPVTLQGSARRAQQEKLPTRNRLELTQQAPQAPQRFSPTPQAPTPQPSSQPPSIRPYEKSVDIVKNLKEEDKFNNIIQSGYDVPTTAAILRQVLPKNKVQVLDKVEGGLEQLVSDYTQFVQDNPPALRDQFSPKNIPKNAPINISETIAQEGMSPETSSPIQQMTEEETTYTPQKIPLINSRIPQENPLKSRVQEAAFGSEEPQKLSQSKLKKESFAIPTYKYPGESIKDFENRKVIDTAVKKASIALMEGKTFLDFPINKEAIRARGGYSVAKDVLSLMAGVPTVYDDLLDDDEKEEIGEVFSENENKIPSKERDIYGAQVTPNLIWNLFLSLEPKIATMERPKTVKGSPGKKMGTPEFRKYLTTSLYGVLSGRKISTELSDKIEKISKASSGIDAIAKAAKDGNIRAIDKEMEKLMDDAYFMEIMSQEIDLLIQEKE